MLIEALRAQLLTARKEKMKGEGSPYAVGLLTALVGEATRIGKDAKPPRDTQDDEVIVFLRKTLKTLEETRGLVEQRVASGTQTRDDELTQVDAEIAIVRAFLDANQPKQMSEDELRTAVSGYVAENPGVQIGAVMGWLKASFAGRYDGKLGSTVAKQVLAGGSA